MCKRSDIINAVSLRPDQVTKSSLMLIIYLIADKTNATLQTVNYNDTHLVVPGVKINYITYYRIGNTYKFKVDFQCNGLLK